MNRGIESNSGFLSAPSSNPDPLAGPVGFETCPLPRLLLDLYRKRFSGTLAVRQSAQQRHFLFLQGAPYCFRPSQPREDFSTWLVTQGLLSPAEQSRSNARPSVQTSEKRSRASFRELPAATAFAQTRAHLHHYLLMSLGWTHGTWETHATSDAGEAVHPLRIDPLALVQSAVQLHWSLEQIIENLAPRLHDTPRFTSSLDPILERLESDTSVLAFVAEVNGQKPLGEILTRTTQSSLGLATAWLLASLGIMIFHARAADTLPKPGVPTCATPDRAHGPTEPRKCPNEPMQNRQLRDQISDRLRVSEKMDAYATLGLAKGASSQEIRKAYRSAAKQFHPDTLSRLDLEDDLREQADLLFSRITQSWRELRKSRTRPLLRREVSKDDPADGEALVRAETLFRKAEVLLRKGNFQGALEFLQPAVEIQPSDASYQSALGWARFRHESNAAESALDHLRIAQSIDPELAGLREKMRRVEAHLERCQGQEQT